MHQCHICGVPADSGFFDESGVKAPPQPGQEVVLARYTLHRNYCGMLLYFAQFTDRFARDATEVETPGYQWQIRCDGQPRDPYLTFDRIINPWGLSGFPVYLRLEEGSVVELAVRRVGSSQGKEISKVGGRILGRYWYDGSYGGAPNRL
ncbi:MAG: hypothetical protein ACRD1U_11865 [Vicinamibacterales bacterium]